MHIQESLEGVTRLFLDTASHLLCRSTPTILANCECGVRSDSGRFANGCHSQYTHLLPCRSCLVNPSRFGQTQLQQDFLDVIVAGNNTTFVLINDSIAQQAGEIRARYNILLPDAFQIAVALAAGCEAFLTNDVTLNRVTELRVLAIAELESV